MKFINLSNLKRFWEKIEAKLNAKQDTLQVGTNIRAINGNSILGSGNLILPKTVQLVSSASLTIDKMLNYIVYVSSVAVSDVTISAFEVPANNYTEYSLVFKSGTSGTTLTLPMDVLWANGTQPTIEADCEYELSISGRSGNLKAVLVPFKAV